MTLFVSRILLEEWINKAKEKNFSTLLLIETSIDITPHYFDSFKLDDIVKVVQEVESKGDAKVVLTVMI